MPHIRLETTSDLPENAYIPEILEALVRRLSEFETVSPASIKAYHGLRSVWIMGEGATPGFAHCEVAILTGRPIELRNSMADALYLTLCEHFTASIEAGDVGVTLEVREMERASYRREVTAS